MSASMHAFKGVFLVLGVTAACSTNGDGSTSSSSSSSTGGTHSSSHAVSSSRVSSSSLMATSTATSTTRSSSSAASSLGNSSSRVDGIGDTCDGALRLTLGASVNGTTETAANDYHFANAASSCLGERAVGNDVVYVFTPATSGSYTFHVGFLGFDAALYLLDACAPALDAAGHVTSCPVGVDAHASTTAEDLTTALTAGVAAFLVVDSFVAGGGTFELSVTAN